MVRAIVQFYLLNNISLVLFRIILSVFSFLISRNCPVLLILLRKTRLLFKLNEISYFLILFEEIGFLLNEMKFVIS